MGLGPVKINTVVKRNSNENEIIDIVERFSNRDIAVRFIEYMDVGTTNGWSLDEVVSASEIKHMIGDIERIIPENKSDVAKRYKLPNGGEIGIISSVTEPFCSDCTRARISSDGRLFTCLFSNNGLDLISPIRAGHTDSYIMDLIRERWSKRKDRYSEERSLNSSKMSERVEMSYIGG